MNVTIKQVPPKVYEAFKETAEKQGRSLNSQIIEVMTLAVNDFERRKKMRESRAELEQFVASLPHLDDDSTDLIREDRDR